MDIEKAQEVLANVDARLKEQEEVGKIYKGLKTDLFDEKKGALAVAKEAYEKIDKVNPTYAMQIALALKKLLGKIPYLKQTAGRFVPKDVREAFKTIIEEGIETPAKIAKDAYNKEVTKEKYQIQASQEMGQLKSVMYGI